MNTASPVMTVTDELLAELELLAGAATPGRWQAYDTHGRRFIDAPGDATVVVMKRSKQELSDSLFIAKANPATITALTAELRRLRAENAELAQSLAESRANDQAAMGWLTSLRWASGDRGERMLPELVAHIEGLAKDAGKYRHARALEAALDADHN